MARPNWEYIRVDVLLPEHPKIDLLSRSARWTLVELWCYCGRQRTDGIVTSARWKTFGTPSERRQILDAGFAERIGPDDSFGYLMHDYLDHQRSREEIDELSAKRTEAAKKAAAARWNGHAKTHALPHTKTHAQRRCVPMPKAEAEAEADTRAAHDRCLVLSPVVSLSKCRH